MPASSPCRLYVYPALDADRAVVLRRGPSAWARLSAWNTADDTFEHGQWFRGRVYERRCDVSPDGRLFVYFAAKQGRATAEDSWIAVSRPPWFQALALWFVGGTYCLGGTFVDARSLYIGWGGDPDQGALPGWLTLAAQPPHVDGTPNASERTVYHARLLRDGWTPTAIPEIGRNIWEKRSPGADATLELMSEAVPDFTAQGDPYLTQYSLRADDGNVADFGPCTWADWDRRGRLLLARDGAVWRWGGRQIEQIADFNTQAPDPLPAPAEAADWPTEP